jgi:hypothetical protein
MRKIPVTTNNRELYEKLKMLYYSPEVVLRNTKRVYVERIIRNINSRGRIILMEEVGNYIILKRISQPNYEVYFR